MEKTITKAYVDDKGFVLLVCSNCNTIQQQEAKSYGGAKGPISITCGNCGNVYDVEIEFRKFYRKGIRVDGGKASLRFRKDGFAGTGEEYNIFLTTDNGKYGRMITVAMYTGRVRVRKIK